MELRRIAGSPSLLTAVKDKCPEAPPVAWYFPVQVAETPFTARRIDGSVCLDTALLLDGIYTESIEFTAKFEQDNSSTVCKDIWS